MSFVAAEEDENASHDAAQWVLVTGRRAFFDDPLLWGKMTSTANTRKVRIWTDDYSNLLQILK